MRQLQVAETPPMHTKFNAGFTLIEILVVVIIISISIAVVVVNFSRGGDQQRVTEEILRLQQLLRFAHQQAVVRGQEYGVRFYSTGYRFMLYDEKTRSWIDLDNDRLLRRRELAEPMELDLYIDQLPVDILESFADDPAPKDKNKLATAATDTLSQSPAAAPAGGNAFLTGSAQPNSKKSIRPQIFLLSSSELVPAFELRIRIPGTDVEEQLEGLPQGEYKRPQPDA